MATYRDQLNVQLAEVAAGRRSAVDPVLQTFVADREALAAREAQKRHDDQTSLLREASRQQAAAARALQDAADDQAAHHARLEALEEERVELQREAVEEARQHRISAHKTLLAQGEQKAQAAKDKEHAERLRTSPCFASANQLLELHLLEMAVQDREAVDSICSEVDALACEFSRDYEVARKAAEPGFKAAWEPYANLLAKNEETAARLREECERTRLEFKACEDSAGLLGWLPKARKHRESLKENQDEALRALTEATACFAADSDAASKSTPEAALEAFTKAFAIRRGVEPQLRAIDAKLDAWLVAAPRSPSAFDFFTSRAPKMTSAAKTIDFAVCASLDHARSEGVPVSYPGLGPLPFGADLATSVNRSAELRAASDPFGDPSVLRKAAIRWLLCAYHLGVYAPSRDMTYPESLELDIHLADDEFDEDPTAGLL